MIVGSATAGLLIEGAQSLKDRRQVVRSLVERLRHRFNVSVCEVDAQVVWQRATLGIAAVGREYGEVTDALEHIRRFIDESSDAELVDWSVNLW